MGTRYSAGDKVKFNDRKGEVIEVQNKESDSPDYIVQFLDGLKKMKASDLKKTPILDIPILDEEVEEGTILIDKYGREQEVEKTDDYGIFYTAENSNEPARISWDEINEKFAKVKQ